MRSMIQDTKFLQNRRGYWHYKRRIPTRYSFFDARDFVRASLKTKSLDTAIERRDALVEADDIYWASLAGIETDDGDDLVTRQRKMAQKRYEAANLRALGRGFKYIPAANLAQSAELEEIVSRIEGVEKVADGGKRLVLNEAEALLGGAPAPPVLISEAFDIYCTEIASDELIGKSETQRRAWRKTKNRGVQYLIDVIGDKPILSLTRQDGQAYYNWWRERLEDKPGRKALSGNTANRDIGNVRKLYFEYCKYIGEEDRANPFRNLSFKDKHKADVPPFEDEWVRARILVPGCLAGVNDEARHIVYALIETGCRPGEISNLMPEDIILNHDVPHIRIRPKKNREIKTDASVRDIPLLGISLEAMRKFPNGFPRYRDKPDLLSANLMKAFKVRRLFPTPDHKIYSFRHSFEKRMLEAGIDHDLRLTLMGHTNKRPAYGDGGSLAYRRDELSKIVHPLCKGVL